MSRVDPPLAGLQIDADKLADYLLDPTHPKGGSKAAFLMRFGFFAADPQALADALAAHFSAAPEARCVIDAAGRTRIVCEGPSSVPMDDGQPSVRSG